MANTQKNPCHALKKAIFRDNVEKVPFFVFKKHKLAGNQFFFKALCSGLLWLKTDNFCISLDFYRVRRS